MTTWPPPSLEVNAEAIVNECELAEVTPMERSMLAPVHMAALLYLGETVHARHLWRRTLERDELLQDWWEVAKAMIASEDVESALAKCAQHPEPLKTYATEISTRPTMKALTQHHALNQEVVSFLETKKWNT